MALPRISLVRRLPATTRSVYAAWTEPAKLALWWGGKGATQITAQGKATVRNSFLVSGRRGDGSVFEDWGRYTVVIPGDVLEFSWKSDTALPCYVVVQLLPIFAGTEITLVHFGLPDAETCEKQRTYWNAALDCLEATLTPWSQFVLVPGLV